MVEAARGLSSSYSWDILVGDTQCNSTVGPLTAVDMVYKHKPQLFLGKMTILAEQKPQTFINAAKQINKIQYLNSPPKKEYLLKINIHYILGPVCPYVLSPVSR